MENRKAVVIYSGGMDSTVLLAQCCEKYGAGNLCALTFNYGSKHSKKEIAAALKMAVRYGVAHRVIEIDFMRSFNSVLLQGGGAVPDGHYNDTTMLKTVVPFRNGIMLALAGGYAESIEAQVVFYGAHTGDHFIYPDCRPKFIAAMKQALKLGTSKEIELEAPFQDIDKRAIALLGKQMGVPFQDTWTCYKGLEKHCGKCGACTERKEALEGFDDTEYL